MNRKTRITNAATTMAVEITSRETRTIGKALDVVLAMAAFGGLRDFKIHLQEFFPELWTEFPTEADLIIIYLIVINQLS